MYADKFIQKYKSVKQNLWFHLLDIFFFANALIINIKLDVVI